MTAQAFDPSGQDDEDADDRARFHRALMTEALKLIEERREERPSLDELAARMGFSPAHFQRLFSRWVGVSPKRYMQALDLDHAKRLLAGRAPLLDAALGAGLSGPGRLHDLFVTWEAMTPAEWARRGRGVVIRRGWFDSPFGEALALGTDRGVCGLAFAADMGREAALADMLVRWPDARHVEDPEPLRPMVEAAFAQKPGARLHVIGAPFQIKVWEALLQAPMGEVTTYSALARAVGKPNAQRAVGTAVGRNPISWLIPCHRAVRTTGALGGYHWGLPVKRAMLAWEHAKTAEDMAAG